ncbi:hypothetical protein SPV1_13047, partial [Mariprofundus ferrooxydans PV-1]
KKGFILDHWRRDACKRPAGEVGQVFVDGVDEFHWRCGL